MTCRSILAVLCLLAAAGCAAPPDPARSMAENLARMAAAKGFQAKHNIARQSCLAAGYAAGSARYVRCVEIYHIWDAARSSPRAVAHTPSHGRGLCVDPVLFELTRCQEI